MKTFLRNNNSKDLIIFFCGWGMDENPFSILNSLSDILFVYDYTTPDFPDGDIDFSKYTKITLLAFSYGVYASAIAKLPSGLNIDKKIAINGTLVPVDDKLGVPVRQFELTEKMNSESVIKFRQRLFGGEKAVQHFEIFENHLPHRSAASCTGELLGMKEYIPSLPVPEMNFDMVYLAEYDRCVPSKNQKNFWQNFENINIIKLETGHFPFYNYKNFEEIIN